MLSVVLELVRNVDPQPHLHLLAQKPYFNKIPMMRRHNSLRSAVPDLWEREGCSPAGCGYKAWTGRAVEGGGEGKG